MDPCNANALSLPVYVDENVAVLRNREFILGYLVSLWKIRVEVVLSGKATFMGNGAIGGQRHAKGIIHYLAVQDRKYSRHTQAYRACVCIWRCAELRGATTKDLGLRQELGMDFKPDNGFILHLIMSPMHISAVPTTSWERLTGKCLKCTKACPGATYSDPPAMSAAATCPA
jgi:hypothetical protein